jgi:hypothetical protein
MMELVTPQREIWTPPRAEIRLHNHFLAEVRDAKTGKLVQSAEAENVFTNLGKQEIAKRGNLSTAPGQILYNCGVGSGTGAPAVTDSALGIQRAAAGIATSTQVGSYQQSLADETNQVWWARRKYMFSETVANYTLSEVGLGYAGFPLAAGTSENSSSGFQTHTRALFKDANGNPISITKTNTQILTITATVYLVRGAVDQNMALLDKFFSRLVQNTETTLFYHRWRLGNGTTAPANTDTNLAGAEVANKASDKTSNSVFWDDVNGVWTTTRPAGKPYATGIHCDWDLNEANVTFSEVLLHGPLSGQFNAGDATNVGIRLVFPCGTVAGTSYTKTDQVKLRQYLEYVWG